MEYHEYQGQLPRLLWSGEYQARAFENGELVNGQHLSGEQLRAMAAWPAGSGIGNGNGNGIGSGIGNGIGDGIGGYATGTGTGTGTGMANGDVNGHVDGNVNGIVHGNTIGNGNGNAIGNVNGNVNGHATGHAAGDLTGDLDSSPTGNASWTATAAPADYPLHQPLHQHQHQQLPQHPLLPQLPGPHGAPTDPPAPATAALPKQRRSLKPKQQPQLQPQQQPNMSPPLPGTAMAMAMATAMDAAAATSATATAATATTATANATTTAAASAAAVPVKTAIAVACIACRSRHLRCDGGARCSRCLADGLPCSYLKSRRGLKTTRRSKGARLATPLLAGLAAPLGSGGDLRDGRRLSSASLISPTDSLLADLVDGHSSVASSTSPTSPTALSLSLPQLQEMPLFKAMPQLAACHNQDPYFPQVVSNALNYMTTYYSFYHLAHPFLLPRDRLQKALAERPAPHLQLAMQFVASCYTANCRTGWFQEAAEQLLVRQQPPRDAFTVQALLLFALGIHAGGESEAAVGALRAATDLALALRMNRRDFAEQHGAGDAVLQESWRRTWWELYITDAMFAGLTQRTSFRLAAVATDVPLPCEEADYFTGQIPPPRTLQDYERAAFDSPDAVFSSFSYRIDAVRILARVLPISDPENVDVQAADLADAHLASWSLHLPAAKREVISRGLEIDEVLFQAHMIILGATILLHRPRSYLSAREVNAVTTCVDPEQSLLPSQAVQIHTAKALRAAEEISKLVTLPVSIVRRSPFFSCVLTMSSVVLLAYWSFFVDDGDDALVKEQIRLNIGGLKTMAATWPVAKKVLCQVRAVAQDMFASRRTEPMAFVDHMIGDSVLREMIDAAAAADDDDMDADDDDDDEDDGLVDADGAATVTTTAPATAATAATAIATSEKKSGLGLRSGGPDTVAATAVATGVGP